MDAYLEARAAEKGAEDAVKAAQKKLDEIGSARGLVGHAKGKWIGGADKGIAGAKAKLAKATTDAERKADTFAARMEKNLYNGNGVTNGERQVNGNGRTKVRPRGRRNAA